MKKLQLLALSMLLSTPFAVTYTAETAENAPAATAPARQDDRQDDRQGNRSDKQDDRQARRQARIAGYQDIKASMEELCHNDDAVEAKKADMQNQLIAQYQAVSAQLEKLPAQGDARLNASDERDMLKEKLTDRKACLEDRIAMIQSWIDKKQAKIAKEQDLFDARQSELAKLKAAGVTAGARFDNLQSQVADFSTCIADKKAAVEKLGNKKDVAQKSLDGLNNSKTIGSGSMMANAANAVSGAAKSVAKSAKKMGLSK